MGMTAVASYYGTCTFIGHNYHNIVYRLDSGLLAIYGYRQGYVQICLAAKTGDLGNLVETWETHLEVQSQSE